MPIPAPGKDEYKITEWKISNNKVKEKEVRICVICNVIVKMAVLENESWYDGKYAFLYL